MADVLAGAIADWRTGGTQPADFDPDVATARAAWADLVGFDADDVATGGAVSQLIGLIAACVADGTRVLTVAGEFTSVTFPFAAQAHRGVEITEVAPADLLESIRPGVDLVVMSVVQSADGAVVDLDGLRAAAAASGTRVLLDVTQALGWLPLRLGWADYVVGSSYKWLLAPRGAAWLGIRRDLQSAIVPQVANWYAGSDPWAAIYGLPLRLADNARRLDMSPVWFAQRGAAVSLTWLAGLDMAAVREHCVGLADATLTGLGLAPRGSAIIALDVTPDAVTRLAEAGVVAAVRVGRTRISFHLYNTAEDVDLVLGAIR